MKGDHKSQIQTQLKKRAVAYIRARADDTDLEAQSAERQLTRCADEIARLDAVMVTYFCDMGESANNLERQGLVDLLHYLDAPDVDISYVVVSTGDRLARNPSDFLDLLAIIEDSGATLKIVGWPAEAFKDLRKLCMLAELQRVAAS